MRIILVGQRDGKRIVRWARLFWLGFALGMIGMYGPGALFYLLTGHSSDHVGFLGLFIGIGIVLSPVSRSMLKPVQELPPIT